MTTDKRTNLDTDDILAKPENFFAGEGASDGFPAHLLAEIEPPEKSPLSIEKQSELLVLLWELSGHVAMLRERAADGTSIRICNFMQRAILDLHGAVPSTDAAILEGRRLIDDMPDTSARKQAIAFKRGKSAEYARKRGFTKWVQP